jgi:hypothetical protein
MQPGKVDKRLSIVSANDPVRRPEGDSIRGHQPPISRMRRPAAAREPRVPLSWTDHSCTHHVERVTKAPASFQLMGGRAIRVR